MINKKKMPLTETEMRKLGTAYHKKLEEEKITTSIYFDGLWQGVFPYDLNTTIKIISMWLEPLVSFTICDPITIVIIKKGDDIK